MTTPEDTKKLKLSTGNIVFLAISIALSVCAFVVIGKDVVDKVAMAVGAFISILFFPSLLSWVVWKISKRDLKSSNITFTVVVVLVLISLFVRIPQYVKEKNSPNELVSIVADIKSDFKRHADNDFSGNFDFDRHLDKFVNSIESFPENYPESKKRVMRVLVRQVQEMRKEGTKWNDKHEDLSRVLVVDYSTVKSKSTIRKFKKKARDFIKATESLRKHIQTILPTTKSELDKIDADESFKNAMFAAMKKRSLKNVRITTELYKVHIQQGKTILNTFDVLERNWGKWEYDSSSGIFLFENSRALNKFNKLLERTDELNNRLLQLSRKLADSI